MDDREKYDELDLNCWKPPFEKSKSPEALDIRNVRLIHADAFKRCPQFAELPSQLTKRLVKIPFTVSQCAKCLKDGILKPKCEYMWVTVTHDHGVTLMGTLNNDPILCDYVKAGDVVAFRREEIVDYQ